MIRTIDRLTGPAGTTPAIAPDAVADRPIHSGRDPAGGTFLAELAEAARGRDVNLSGHALRRIGQRGIDLADDGLDRLRSAMDQLAVKGGRQSLVMLDRVAYVVHVPSHTIVTAVAPDEGGESVFTHIDSVVIA